jgi:homoserine O-acetyltransferase
MPADAAITAPPAAESRWPNYRKADFVIRDDRFLSGGTIDALRLYWRTLGTARRDAAGRIVESMH